MVERAFKPIRALVSGFIDGINFSLISRITAFGFILAVIFPNIATTFVSAYGLVQFRSVYMSNSAPSATNVNYFVSFKPASVTTIGSIDVDFCSNDPIIGDTCTAPAGFTMTSSSVSTPTGFSTSTGSWAALQNAGHTSLFESNGTPQTPTGTSTAITFTISVVTNPSATGSFYAKIYTFDTQNHGNSTNYLSGAGGTPGTGITDAGGVALSTVVQVTVTAKVQETITFCVYTSIADSGNCSGTGTAVTLGSTNGVLFSTQNYVDITTKYDVQTNAQNGAYIVMTGTPPTSGSNVIEYNTVDGMGTTAGSNYNAVPGVTSSHSQFGLCTWGSFGTTANLTPVSPYNDATCHLDTQTSGPTGSGAGTGDDSGTTKFGFDIANAANTGTFTSPYGYGTELATVTAGAFAGGQIAFVGNIAPTQIAGIYTTVLTFIATGSY